MWTKLLLMLMALLTIVHGFEAPVEKGCPPGSEVDTNTGV